MERKRLKHRTNSKRKKSKKRSLRGRKLKTVSKKENIRLFSIRAYHPTMFKCRTNNFGNSKSFVKSSISSQRRKNLGSISKDSIQSKNQSFVSAHKNSILKKLGFPAPLKKLNRSFILKNVKSVESQLEEIQHTSSIMNRINEEDYKVTNDVKNKSRSMKENLKNINNRIKALSKEKRSRLAKLDKVAERLKKALELKLMKTEEKELKEKLRKENTFRREKLRQEVNYERRKNRSNLQSAKEKCQLNKKLLRNRMLRNYHKGEKKRRMKEIQRLERIKEKKLRLKFQNLAAVKLELEREKKKNIEKNKSMFLQRKKEYDRMREIEKKLSKRESVVNELEDGVKKVDFLIDDYTKKLKKIKILEEGIENDEKEVEILEHVNGDIAECNSGKISLKKVSCFGSRGSSFNKVRDIESNEVSLQNIHLEYEIIEKKKIPEKKSKRKKKRLRETFRISLNSDKKSKYSTAISTNQKSRYSQKFQKEKKLRSTKYQKSQDLTGEVFKDGNSKDKLVNSAVEIRSTSKIKIRENHGKIEESGMIKAENVAEVDQCGGECDGLHQGENELDIRVCGNEVDSGYWERNLNKYKYNYKKVAKVMNFTR